MKVMVSEDVVANKLVAFYERIGKTNRDIYDTWFFFKNDFPINQELVKKGPICPSGISFEPVVTFWKKWTINAFSPVWGILTEKQKYWVKTKLREDLLFQLRLYLDCLAVYRLRIHILIADVFQRLGIGRSDQDNMIENLGRRFKNIDIAPSDA